MNQKQLAYLQTLLTPEQLTTFLEMKKTRPKKVETPVKVIQIKQKCQANKKDKTNCSHNALSSEKYCGVHLKTLEKVVGKLTDDVILSATA